MYINKNKYKRIRRDKFLLNIFLFGELKYGGEVRFTFKDPNNSGNSDGYYMWLVPVSGTKNFDSKRKECTK